MFLYHFYYFGINLCVSLYFLDFIVILLPINQNFVVWLFIFVNIHSFISINFLTIAYNTLNSSKIRSLTLQLKFAFIVIAFLIIYNYINLYFGGYSYSLSSKNITVVSFQNALTFILWNPFSLFLTIILSLLCDGSLWNPSQDIKLFLQPFKGLLSFKQYSKAYLYHNSQRTL